MKSVEFDQLKQSLQSEILNLRSLLDSEKQRTQAAYQDCSQVDGEKRMA